MHLGYLSSSYYFFGWGHSYSLFPLTKKCYERGWERKKDVHAFCLPALALAVSMVQVAQDEAVCLSGEYLTPFHAEKIYTSLPWIKNLFLLFINMLCGLVLGTFYIFLVCLQFKGTLLTLPCKLVGGGWDSSPSKGPGYLSMTLSIARASPTILSDAPYFPYTQGLPRPAWLFFPLGQWPTANGEYSRLIPYHLPGLVF